MTFSTPILDAVSDDEMFICGVSLSLSSAKDIWIVKDVYASPYRPNLISIGVWCVNVDDILDADSDDDMFVRGVSSSLSPLAPAPAPTATPLSTPTTTVEDAEVLSALEGRWSEGDAEGGTTIRFGRGVRVAFCKYRPLYSQPPLCGI